MNSQSELQPYNSHRSNIRTLAQLILRQQTQTYILLQRKFNFNNWGIDSKLENLESSIRLFEFGISVMI